MSLHIEDLKKWAHRYNLHLKNENHTLRERMLFELFNKTNILRMFEENQLAII